ncbi:MAG: replicative DNA helicase [Candidatus Shikimatogenerans bostrichidophilus]|nr:MAG: replicative DNA helicase [Candidatus Shikimatogenerans bostrichidophilus]
MNLQKQSPNSIKLEEAVLGSIIINKKSLEKVIDILKPEFFYLKKNKIIFKYIKKLFYEYNKIDFLTLISELKKDNVLNVIGGEIYISYIINNNTNFNKIEKYVKILIEKFILRKLIKLSTTIINRTYRENTNTLDLLNYIQINIDDIYIKYIKNNLRSIKHLIPKTIKRINNKNFLYIPTGFNKLDNIILGLQKSDLIIIASRPGMGKTSFALSLIINIIKRNIPIGLFSLEMSYYQIISRLITLETKISYEKLNTINLTKKELKIFKKKIKNIKKYPLYIDDSPYLSLIDLKNKCRKLIYKHNVKLIIIDYLQLINVNDIKIKNREQEISTISRNIKYIAKEFKIPIIAISQLSRAVEIRGGYKRPMLSDLRESGAIEQDADIVLLLYRPDYYGFKYWDNDYTTLCEGQAEIIIAKHRNGKLGNIKLKFIKTQAKFKNL